jgi:hypothetical protein
MRGRQKRIDKYNHGVTTLYIRINRFLEARVGQHIDTIRSEFVRTMLPGVGASMAQHMRKVFEDSFIQETDAHQSWLLFVTLPRRSFFIVGSNGVIRMHEKHRREPEKPKQDLFPVPAKLWANKGFPEAWEKRKGVWHRVSFAYPKCLGFGFSDAWKREPYARTNNNPAFKDFGSTPFSCHTCSKKEIKQLILPALKAMGVSNV